MTIRIKYPYIPGNNLCDGTVHQIEPIRLCRIIGLPLLLLEYFDQKVEAQCITIILVDNQGFHKVPLLGYDELFEILNNEEWLEPIDIGILPDIIGANKPARDWPELILASLAGSPPPNDPLILCAAAGGDTPRQPFYHYLPSREVITLYIDGETVMRREYDRVGHIIFPTVSYDSLCKLLDEYDIIWRHIDETLVKEEDEINLVLRACERRLSNENVFYRIQEVGLADHDDRYLPPYYDKLSRPHYGKPLPPYYGRHIHRYQVNITRR